MLQRKMLDYLRHWRTSHHQECLLINGARQVGKSYVVQWFGEQDYQHLVLVDFIKNPALSDAFSGSLEVDDITARLTLYLPDARFVPGQTLIFLDEIQECPQARAALKYFALDGRYDVIASGSLLGIRFRQMEEEPSLPVGYERQVTMRPLDFEEFLWALGYQPSALDTLKGFLARMEPVPASLNERMMRHLREYLAIGGMPAVVQAFVSENSFSSAHDAQLQLHALYLDDVARYAPPSERVKARACYLSLPQQLAKENTRFAYKTVEANGRARKFQSSVDWLVGAELALPCYALSTAKFPLTAYEQRDRFRLYANDTGLLMAMYDFAMKAAVVDNALTGPMKGGLYENLAACMLASHGKPLRYWMSSDSKSEIEFVLDGKHASVVPVEVKAGRGSSASLDSMLKRDDVEVGYKFIDGNLGTDGKKVTLPLYMLAFLFDSFHTGKQNAPAAALHMPS